MIGVSFGFANLPHGTRTVCFTLRTLTFRLVKRLPWQADTQRQADRQKRGKRTGREASNPPLPENTHTHNVLTYSDTVWFATTKLTTVALHKLKFNSNGLNVHKIFTTSTKMKIGLEQYKFTVIQVAAAT